MRVMATRSFAPRPRALAAIGLAALAVARCVPTFGTVDLGGGRDASLVDGSAAGALDGALPDGAAVPGADGAHDDAMSPWESMDASVIGPGYADSGRSNGGSQVCDPTWPVDLVTGHRYQLFDSALDEASASAFCAAAKAHLITIDTDFEQAWATEGIDLWIGAFDLADGSGFRWGTGAPLTYSNWRDGEPNGDGFCVKASADATGTWDDFACSIPLPFVCECEP
jgi:lectin-like protein